MIKSFLPAFCWLLVILYLSTQGGIPVPDFNLFQMDKLAHAAAYGLLTWLSLWGLMRLSPSRRFSLLSGAAVFLFATGFGALMELVQYQFFPDRYFEYDDMLANAIGAAIGWGTFAWLLQKPFFTKIRYS